jgi:signal transduction histidine kinase
VLSQRDVDVVFVDYQLGARTGVEVLAEIRAAEYLGPVIVLSGQGDEQVAAEIMRAGADDYLVKDDLSPAVLRRSLKHSEAKYLRRCAQVELRAKSELLARMLEREQRSSRQLATAIERAEAANRAKSEFLAKMSHELRTPLNSIIGFTDLMIDDRKDPPRGKRARRLEKVQRNARNLLALISDILDLSKIEADRISLSHDVVDVAELLTQCVEAAQPLITGSAVELRPRLEQLSAAESEWQGDELRLRQIVTNLLSNAAKFTDKGWIEVRAHVADGSLHIEVEDTGVGIAAQHLTAIFDEFQQVDSSSTRRAGGTGLGLAITRKLCGLMGGGVRVMSTLGSGSCFCVRLPLVPAEEVGPIVADDRCDQRRPASVGGLQ